jgi:hypothetical protein
MNCCDDVCTQAYNCPAHATMWVCPFCYIKGCQTPDKCRSLAIRNHTLDEVANEFDKMKSLGDTAASFAAFVRNMKR